MKTRSFIIHFLIRPLKTKETEIGAAELSSIHDCASEYTGKERKM